MRFRSSIVLIGMFFLFCKAEGDPVATVKLFVKAINTGDFKKAETLIGEGYKQQLETLKKKLPPPKIVVYKYTLREKNDSTAIVDLLVPRMENIPETSLQVHLEKVKSKWLIGSIY